MGKRRTHDRLSRQKWVQANLKKACLKQTQFRIALLQLFFQSTRPLSAAQIYRQLQRTRGGKLRFDRATLFRNLKALAQKSVLSTTEFGTGSNFFMRASENSSHRHHFFCVKCETAEPIDHCGISPMIKKAQDKGLRVFSHRLELLGLCARCR